MSGQPLQLGRPVRQPASPAEAVLDRVPNPHPGTDYVSRFIAPEFTCMCPVTGQPDFAILVIDYVPNRWLIESKSLKLYLNSFRNHGAFHEQSTVTIGKRLVALLKRIPASAFQAVNESCLMVNRNSGQARASRGCPTG